MAKKSEVDTRHRKTKAALAAGAVAGTVAATAAYRRRQTRQHQEPAYPPQPVPTTTSGPATGQPL